MNETTACKHSFYTNSNLCMHCGLVVPMVTVEKAYIDALEERVRAAEDALDEFWDEPLISGLRAQLAASESARQAAEGRAQLADVLIEQRLLGKIASVAAQSMGGNSPEYGEAVRQRDAHLVKVNEAWAVYDALLSSPVPAARDGEV